MHAAANCANCETPLTGPYCAQCGQHAHESSRSVGALFHDAWHAMSHVDGRFWQTLATLLLRPGHLTREYFAERRAHYLPPVRLYLVLSVLVFAFAAIGPHADERAGGAAKSLPADPDAAAAVRHELDDAVKEAETISAPSQRLNIRAGKPWDPAQCKSIEVDWPWLEGFLRGACVSNAPDGGMTVRRVFAASVPKMLFVLLPIMALVMRLLYWRPRHYYVEHLVFFLHAHAAVFLVLIFQLLLSRLAALLPAFGWLARLADFATTLYLIWYVYKAMRVYYAQDRWLTLAKFGAVGFAYFFFFALTALTTLALVVTLVT